MHHLLHPRPKPDTSIINNLKLKGKYKSNKTSQTVEVINNDSESTVPSKTKVISRSSSYHNNHSYLSLSDTRVSIPPSRGHNSD